MSASQTASAVHEVARLGFNAAQGQDLYDRARPNFPAESMSSILASALAASSGRPLRIVELGAGTGISTRALLDTIVSLNNTAADTDRIQVSKLFVYEPSPGMRASFDRALQAKLPEYTEAQVFTDGSDSVEVSEGTFEDFSLLQDARAQASIDVILIAQAWHWAQDHEVALSNFARVLRPYGCLSLIWNLEDRDAAPWVARIRDAYEKHEHGSPQYRLGLWKKMYQTEALTQYFQALPQEDYTRILPTTHEAAWNRVLSKSYISLLGQDDLAALRKEYDQIMEDGDQHGRRWINKDEGVFEYPYITNLFKFVRK
ncbi:hypothetical protein OC834_006151 [Tilletia horrida]|nr:hypothetical protein OC834_006151 [Tilletia horrida]KAK0522937.1 hypothetical protein OC835_006414 [Tilletia horrida]